MPSVQADKIVDQYVCSACWGGLQHWPVKDADGKIISGERNVKCAECGDNTPGFVSSSYVERRIQESKSQWYMARDALREAVPWMFPKREAKSEAAILSELGY